MYMELKPPQIKGITCVTLHDYRQPQSIPTVFSANENNNYYYYDWSRLWYGLILTTLPLPGGDKLRLRTEKGAVMTSTA
jgi:hypothetical protein